MTLAMTLAPSAVSSRARPLRATVQGWDVLALATLAALWFAVLAFRYDALPMQLWDESRNANNALEMALNGHWLAPTYAGVVDHWNTKPPLMIWAMAAMLKLGLPPLLALRAPAMAAALVSAGLVWAALRIGLKDRRAGFAGALLLLSAPLYVGLHGARTADYDAPEAAFILAYVLAAWTSLESGRAGWLLAASVALALGVLTKGVAALLPLPGLLLFAMIRPARLGVLLRRWETWAGAALFLAAVGGYYLAREHADPGYLRIVARNELGGRFLQVTENHRGGAGYYLALLAQEGGPGVVLSGLSVLLVLGSDARRRSLAAAAALSAVSLVAVLSLSRSKMEWYAIPVLPLVCLLAGLGVSEALARAATWTSALNPKAAALAAITLRCGLVLVLAAAAASVVVSAQALPGRRAAEAGAAQYRYGEFLEKARGFTAGRPVTVVDTGFRNDAGFAGYDPMLKFYADLSTSRGLPVRVQATDADLAGALAGSCDRRAIGALAADHRLQPLLRGRGCLLARVLD